VAQSHQTRIVAVNQVGANDDLIFDGRSAVIDADGSVRHAMRGWQAAVETVSLEEPIKPAAAKQLLRAYEPMRELYHGLVLGIHDYWVKTGNQDALIGLSGGIDSALTATLAVAALGASHVQGVIMPSQYSSPGSLTDSLALATNLGMPSPLELPIEKPHQALQDELNAVIGKIGSLTDENLQARIRGVLLMALANDRNALVLVTGNKSELAVGYSTIYGDMCGAVAVLGDVLKTVVYELARWINTQHEELGFSCPPIPEASITKLPSAELRPDQTDQDSLPPYEVLDEIITGHVDLELTVDEIARSGHIEPSLVEQYTQVIDRVQYKRDQAAIILKVTGRAFGRGRPMPVVMKSTFETRRSAESH
jgi:NAD+ synthetase